MKHYLSRAMLALSSAAAIIAASCSGDFASAQVINPSQPATGVPVAGTGISVAGQTVSVNYGTVANTSLQGNALHAPTAIGDTTPNTGAFTTLSTSGTATHTGSTVLTGTVSGAGIDSYIANHAVVQTLLNVAALRTTACVSGLLYQTQGYAALADGGSGLYVCNGTDTTTTDNGGNIIAASNTFRYYLQRPTNGHLNVRTFGAKGDNSTNDQAAIQAALTWAGNNLSGVQGTTVVEMPPGQYVINSGLTIPQWVILNGANWLPDPSNGAQSDMTTIVVNFGSGLAPESGNQAVTMNHSSGIDGINFYYPGQAAKTASTPVTFDYTISTPVGGSAVDNVSIKNITLYNSYAGINASNGGRIRIDNIQGDPLFMGLKMHGNFDVCYVSRVHFWNFYTQGAALETWVAANGTGYYFGRVDGLQGTDLFVWNMSIGFDFESTDSGALWANIKGLVVDSAETPLKIAAASQINITDFQLISNAHVKPAIVVSASGGNINFGQGQISSAASVGAELLSTYAASMTFAGVNFNNQHSAVVAESASGTVYLNGCTWNVPPFAQNNVFIDGQPLGAPSTSVAYPAITATGTASGAGANWTFPLTAVNTSTIYFPFQDMNQRESVWVLEFNYNVPVPTTTWYFQVLVQTDVGTLTQVSYAPTYPLILTGSTPLVRIPIHAGYTQFISRVIIQVVTTSGVASSSLQLTNIAMYEQDNQHTSDSQIAMYKNRGLYLDAYNMGQVLYSKGKNRRVLTQPQTGYRTPEIPTAGTWAVGDEVEVFNPTATGCLKYINTTAGTPGTWTCLQLP